MMTFNRFLANALITLGMLSASAVSIANVQEAPQANNSVQASQQALANAATNNTLASTPGGEEEPQEYEQETSSTYSTSSQSWAATHSGGEDASLMINSTNNTVSTNNKTQIDEAGVTVGEGEQSTFTYPTFTEAEMNELFNVVAPTDGNGLMVEDGNNETSNTELVYLEDAATRYRSLPVNPVYTYGTDDEGKGVCAGTEEFCTKSATMWETFEGKVSNKEPITVTDSTDGTVGQLLMPEDYQDSASHMPAVNPGECPDGYTAYPFGNEDMGVKKAHCGKVAGPSGNLYRVRPLR